ncbi:MAG: sialate O-acetylesterase [Pirellulaceae bacterium]
MPNRRSILEIAFCVLAVLGGWSEPGFAETQPVRIFIFAGQSNMVGSDSKVADIQRFPPFAGLDQAQEDVRFWYCLGREDKTISDGWVSLQPVNNLVGPELSFAREVRRHSTSPIAIIKIAAGGTHLGGDWNPDSPSGFKLYPLALQQVRTALQQLQAEGVDYRLEGFMWHQGENDMFDADYMAAYGANLKNFLACWRRDLSAPHLRFYIGELCTKTIWGMDLRPRMYAISLGQRQVTDADPLADYVPTSHVGVEVGGGVGLHYHYGTLGQLEHGVNYAQAYLANIGQAPKSIRSLDRWPYPAGSTVKLFVMAGHRNMEGERAFVQELTDRNASLRKDNRQIAYRYNLGGGYRISNAWEPLGPAGDYDTFGPELSFAAALLDANLSNMAIAKFTHSGSQIIDWTREGSEAKSRNLYPAFIDFVNESVRQLEAKGHTVELAGVFYHLGENDMSWSPFRSKSIERLTSLIAASRQDLQRPDLKWYVSQQRPTDDESVNSIDVVSMLETAAQADPHLIHIKAFAPPAQPEALVLNTNGIVWLGQQIADAYLQARGDLE